MSDDKTATTGDGSVSVARFPAVTALASFHELLDDARASVGDDHDNVPLAVTVLVLRADGIDQFTLTQADATLTLLGALDVQRQTLLDNFMYGGDDD